MGVYIDIIQSFPCPTCGSLLTGWQSKKLAYDGYPIAIVMQRYTLNKKMGGEIHTTCDQCGYVEYRISSPSQ